MATQVTLVSLYGKKTQDLTAAIGACQEFVTHAIGPAFTRYDIDQVHATIVGLERHAAPAWNANFSKYQRRDAEMDFTGFLAYLRGCADIPFKVQLGGFGNRQYPFTSRNASPYERSFSVQGDKVVMMGWPVIWQHGAPTYPPTLNLIRRAAQRFGILHAFHRSAADVDNDLYFRLGLLSGNATTPQTICALEVAARQFISMQPPLIVDIRLEDFYIAAYEDDRLPVASTRVRSLADPEVTGGFIAGLFQ